MEKIYKVKPSYETTVRKLSGHQLRSESIVFVEGSNLHNELLLYNVLDLFCEELPPEVDAWKEPQLRSDLPILITDKAMLLIRMQSWADYHNKLDGFAADWKDDRRYKYGLCIYQGICCGIATFNDENYFLFQISVSSEDRAKQMMDYFQKDIQSLIDKGLI